MKQFLRGFGFAFNGIKTCLLEERNFRVHLCVAVYVCLLAPYFNLTRGEWAILLLTIGLVLVCEAVNTAIERLVDLASPSLHPLAKAAKDVAAGSVLLCGLIAVGVAIFLLTKPEGWQAMLQDFSNHIWKLIALITSVPLLGWLAFRSYSSKND